MLIVLSLGFLVSLAIGVPIAFSLGIGAVLSLIVGHIPLQIIAQYFYKSINSFPLLAIPMFVLAGELMRRSGLIKGLLIFSETLVGHITGGLGHVNVIASMFFGGMTGAAVADTSALGPLEIELMTEGGYDRDFSTALTVASSSIGPIIPPSIPMVLYGVATGVSIGGLFLGGLIPGVMVGLGLLITVYVFSKIRNYPKRKNNLSVREFFSGLRSGLLSLGVPVIVIGGIIGGFITPTEASALAVCYALLVGGVFMHSLNLRDIYDSVIETGIVTAVVLLILGCAGTVSYVITTQQVAVRIGAVLSMHISQPWIFLLIVNILMLIVGLFLDTGAAIIIFAPIMVPLTSAFGIDPIHFGVVMVMNLVIGLITPPVGSVLFVGCSIGQISLERLVKAVFPFVLVELAVLLLITYIPIITMFLPRMFGF